MFSWPPKARRLCNTFKSKLIIPPRAPPPRPPPSPPPLFFCCAALKRERYVLISHSFQEKYIPERSFHVCHITEEKVFPPELAGGQPSPPNGPGHVHAAQVGEQPAQFTQAYTFEHVDSPLCLFFAGCLTRPAAEDGMTT